MGEKLVERIDAIFLPVVNLEESIKWYTETLGLTLRWKNTKMAGLAVAPNCGFHLVEVEEYNQPKGYTPFNFVVKDVTEIRNKLIEKNVEVSDLRQGEPVRFDMFDLNGTPISIIQL